MSLPIKTLPIVERWDCSGCGLCCRGHVVPLDPEDLQRLHEQNWERHPEMRGIKTVARRGLIGGQHQLAQRDDGSCVFLMEDGLCRIHKEFGFENKPLICRMYPLQLVPTGNTAYLSLRRSCPTAAEGKGRTLDQYRGQAKRFAKERPSLVQETRPPRIVGRHRRSWDDTLLVTDAFSRLLRDERYPLVRRIAHGLVFCQLLQQCRLRKLSSEQLRELLPLLRESVYEETSERFRDRARPPAGSQALFRQTVLDYLRLHPRYKVRESWRERWKLTKAAFAFAAGRGEAPRLHPSFPAASFEAMEEPLGHLEETVQRPFLDYFEAAAASGQYAFAARPSWSLLDKYRALALAYPAALWMLRYFREDRPPQAGDAIDLVTTLERGQGFAPLTRRQHQRRVATLASTGHLTQLVIWYAR